MEGAGQYGPLVMWYSYDVLPMQLHEQFSLFDAKLQQQQQQQQPQQHQAAAFKSAMAVYQTPSISQRRMAHKRFAAKGRRGLSRTGEPEL
jgi:anti-sigma factor ChrR (cupin superfamily)